MLNAEYHTTAIYQYDGHVIQQDCQLSKNRNKVIKFPFVMELFM